MKPFKFRLRPILHLREAHRDERRAQLAEALAAERKLLDRKEEILAEAAQQQKRDQQAATPGAVDLDYLLDSFRYRSALKQEIAIVEQQEAKLAPEIERRRQALVAADRDVKVVENLREKRAERHRQEEELAEMKQIDEMAGRIFAESSAAERTP